MPLLPRPDSSLSQLGSTTVGIRTPFGVVLGVEKRVSSKLLESSSIEKIMEIDSHIGCAMSGLTADARTMVDHARVTSQNHAFTYDEPVGVESCAQAVCDLALRFGESVEEDEALMVSFLPSLTRRRASLRKTVVPDDSTLRLSPR